MISGAVFHDISRLLEEWEGCRPSDLPGCLLEHVLAIVLYALGDGFLNSPRG
jgi:hypothetical protein